MSGYLRSHGLQHTRFPCPLPSPRVWSNSCPMSRLCHLTISSSAALFSSCPQSFPVLGFFPMSHLFAVDGQHIGASASASVLPMNIQGLIPFRIDGFDLLADQERLLQQHNSKPSILRHSVFFMAQLATWFFRGSIRK